jgi:NAD(P)-dependent dehydrogenase (short-subunit alcohol dehydrogenase family)
MKIDLAGKTALITGSTSGMGFAAARALATSGATIILHGRTDEHVTSARQRLRQELPDAEVRGVAASTLKRFIHPSEVANLIVFLASEQASAITGAVMRVDGGSIRFVV